MSRRLPAFLRPAEVDALLNAARASVDHARTKSKRRCALRDLVMILTGLYCGLRVAELCALQVQELDLIEGTCFVNQGKGSKDRIVPVPDRIIPELQAWIGERKDGFAFPGPRGKWLSERTFQDRLEVLATAAGIGRECHPHTLRHVYATSLLKSGADIKDVQMLLGHANLATTALYLHCELSKLKSVVNRL